jgi:hypothetical protein
MIEVVAIWCDFGPRFQGEMTSLPSCLPQFETLYGERGILEGAQPSTINCRPSPDLRYSNENLNPG